MIHCIPSCIPFVLVGTIIIQTDRAQTIIFLIVSRSSNLGFLLITYTRYLICNNTCVILILEIKSNGYYNSLRLQIFRLNFTITANLAQVPTAYSNNYTFIYMIPLIKYTLINKRALCAHYTSPIILYIILLLPAENSEPSFNEQTTG